MEKTTINVGIDTRKELMLFKIQSDAKSMDAVIKKVIEKLKEELKEDNNDKDVETSDALI